MADDEREGFGLDRPAPRTGLPESAAPTAKTRVTLTGLLHKTFEGEGKDLDRLSFAERMAQRRDAQQATTGVDGGIRKRYRQLADGTRLVYKGGLGSPDIPIGKITATAPSGGEVQEAWERFLEEWSLTLDHPDQRTTIQPAFLVWDEDDLLAEPCGMLVTNKFGPPYYYIPRVANGETMFTLTQPGYELGSGYDYTLGSRRRLRTSRVNFWPRSQTEGTADIVTTLAPCYRAAAGELFYEDDDLVRDYHGQPEESNGLQAIYAYHIGNEWFYDYADCPSGTTVTRRQRLAPNYEGDDWTSKTGPGTLVRWWREQEVWSGFSQASHVYFDGDCGHLAVDDGVELYDAKWRKNEVLSVFEIGYSYTWCGVSLDIPPGYPIDPLFTLEYLYNLNPADPEWPYPLGAGTGSYYGETTASTANVSLGNVVPDQYAYAVAEDTPYVTPFAIPFASNVRSTCHATCACPVPLPDEWYLAGYNTAGWVGQVLRDASGAATQEWLAFVRRIVAGDAYFDHKSLTNEFEDLWLRTSRGYARYLGKVNATSCGASDNCWQAALWDTRSEAQAARGGTLKAVAIWGVTIQDGTDTYASAPYPPFLGPFQTWGGAGWGGGRTGVGCTGDSFSLSGTDKMEIGFIMTGRTALPASPPGINVVVESGGTDAVCWRRIITPDYIVIHEDDPMGQDRYAYYKFTEEQACAHIWPPKSMLAGVEADWPANAHFREGVVPVKIYHKARTWLRISQHPGKTTRTAGVVTRPKP